eukprot:9265184-Pyramimonas_sp.AAC.1
MTRGMNITRNTFHASRFVEGLPCTRTTSDGSTCENSQWVLGWMKYYQGQHWPNARALAKSVWTNAPRVFVTPMVYSYAGLLR